MTQCNPWIMDIKIRNIHFVSNVLLLLNSLTWEDYRKQNITIYVARNVMQVKLLCLKCNSLWCLFLLHLHVSYTIISIFIWFIFILFSELGIFAISYYKCKGIFLEKHLKFWNAAMFCVPFIEVYKVDRLNGISIICGRT